MRAHARAYIRTRAAHFSGISFSGNGQGSAFLLWIGVARVFPENGWTGVGFQVVAGHFQREMVDRGRRPAAFPSGLIVINGHKKKPQASSPGAIAIIQGKGESFALLYLPV